MKLGLVRAATLACVVALGASLSPAVSAAAPRNTAWLNAIAALAKRVKVNDAPSHVVPPGAKSTVQAAPRVESDAYRELLAEIRAARVEQLATRVLREPSAGAPPYPASRFMDAWMAHWAGRGLRGEQLLCKSAYFTMFTYAQYVTGPAIGVENFGYFVVHPYEDFAYKCPGHGLSETGSVHYGITNPYARTDVGEGPGPYVSVRCTATKDACAGADGEDARSTVYYVAAHETGHAYAWHFHAKFSPDGYVDAECWADDFAVAIGARDLFDYCR